MCHDKYEAFNLEEVRTFSFKNNWNNEIVLSFKKWQGVSVEMTNKPVEEHRSQWR